MTYTEAIEYIHSVSWRGSVPGLSRIEELCERMGHPEKDLRCIHIAGTNGKGSTAAYLTAVLRAAGYRVGTFTSPYVRTFNERIAIDGKPYFGSKGYGGELGHMIIKHDGMSD